MPGILNISEATSLALHTMGILAANSGRPITGKKIATALGGSEAHLAKVLQRLVKGGLVRSARGRGGGFKLAKPPEEIALLDVYELLEGRWNAQACLLKSAVCGRRGCMLGGLLTSINEQMKSRLASTTLAMLDGFHL
jgi:Rrf2 family protein